MDKKVIFAVAGSGKTTYTKGFSPKSFAFQKDTSGIQNPGWCYLRF